MMLKKALKRLSKIKIKDMRTRYLPRLRYPAYYKKLPINEKLILLEAQHGVGVNGNIYYLLQELCRNPRYNEFTICLAVTRDAAEKVRGFLHLQGMDRVQTVYVHSRPYLKAVASAKYLMNDTTFLPFFVKKPGQVYLNTWHGTPLKTLGCKVHNDLHNIGNVQKNFIMADYLLYPNEYTMEHMVEDYMLENLAPGKILLTGYPRNGAFFDTKKAAEIRKAIEAENKRVYAFLPTWRGAVGRVDPRATTYVQYYLYEMDRRLTEDEILYVNLHPLARQDVDFAQFKHILPFPEEYETYEFLNAADVLITDYSSVFYDFAVTRKKCVLFTYDEEEYFADRGLYRPLSSLPFPNTKTVDELFRELRTPKQYDDTAFLKEYCPYDSADAAAKLCARVIFNEQNGMEERAVPHNGKENVLMYVGNLAQNGITTSLMNLLRNLDTTQYNYYLTFVSSAVRRNKEVLAHLPEGVKYIATAGKMNLGFWKKLVYMFFMARLFPINAYLKIMKDEYPMEIRRNYGDIQFQNVIQFNGYETKKIIYYSMFDANRTIYVHSDMEMEMKTRNNQRRNVLQYAYNTYDHVAIVTEDLEAPTRRIMQSEKKLDPAHNLITDDRIRRKGTKPVQFDEQTQCNVPFETLCSVLKSPAKKIVSVGRYSPEKGHKRLIDGFVNAQKDMPDSYLVIIGGNQRDGLYDELCEYVQTLPCADRIILILSMSNPFPVVKACDGFLLSSFYEGFGLVLAEADILGLPVISTDITGPQVFMKKFGGTMVENSDAGVEKGIRMLLNGEVPHLKSNYKAYNKQAVDEFLALLRKDDQK